MRSEQDEIPRFLFFSLSWVASQGVFLAEGNPNTIPHLTGEKLRRYRFPRPPEPEQQAIADFLDRETAKIDMLIEKKRTLIERLKEKRTALISRAVTHGLPPDAARAAGFEPHPKLKASGVDWLGNVPKHWEIKPVKSIARVGNGSTPNRDNDAYWDDGVYPWLNSSVANQEFVNEAQERVTSRALGECHLPSIIPPAVLVGITGQGKTRGKATVLLIEATINQHLAFVKPTAQRANVAFLRRVFDSAYGYLRDESDGGGSTKGAITCELISSFRVPVPPLAEQEAIADFLDRQTGKISQMLAKVETAIERLQEYRSALITAAVTGKIDVRAAVAEERAGG